MKVIIVKPPFNLLIELDTRCFVYDDVTVIAEYLDWRGRQCAEFKLVTGEILEGLVKDSED